MILRDILRAQLDAAEIGLTLLGKLRTQIASGARVLRLVPSGMAYLDAMRSEIGTASSAVGKAVASLNGGQKADLTLEGEAIRVLLLALFLYQDELAKASKKLAGVGIPHATEADARHKAVASFIRKLSTILEEQFPLLFVAPLEGEEPGDEPPEAPTPEAPTQLLLSAKSSAPDDAGDGEEPTDDDDDPTDLDDDDDPGPVGPKLVREEK